MIQPHFVPRSRAGAIAHFLASMAMDGIESRLPEYYDTSFQSSSSTTRCSTTRCQGPTVRTAPPPCNTQDMIAWIIGARRPALFVPLLAALAAVALAQQRVCPISDL
jgi:hypothetical protein